jgi:hypothetical protein
MDTVIGILKVIHILNAVLMAWPFYALVAVNQRARLGPPLGDRTDMYLENVIKNRTIPCFVFQGTALITGLALVRLRGLGFDSLLANPALGLKFLLLLLIAGVLAYVHTRVQPRIDALFSMSRNASMTPDIGQQIGALRLRRKRLASVCLFVVLTLVMLGVQVWAPFPVWLTLSFLLAIGLFTRRTYTSVTPYGWV